MSKTEDLDDFFTKVGAGKWTFLFLGTAAAYQGALPIYLIGSDFLNGVTSYSCDIPDNNRTKLMDGSHCEMIQEEPNGSVQIVACERWIYDKSVFYSTITMEWNLVCSRAWLSPLFQTIFTAGRLLGAILGGMISNSYGRRCCVRTGALLTVGFTIVLLFSRWLWLILLARFLLGVFTAMLASSIFTISVEICKPSLRLPAAIIYGVSYALMMVGLAGLAYWIRYWRQLQAAASWPCLLLVVLAYSIDESPRWLILNGRLEEAINVLQRSIRLNQSIVSQDIDVSAFVHSLYQKQNQTETQNSLVRPQHCSSNTQDLSSATKVNKTSLNQPSNGLGLEDGIGPWWAGPTALLRTKIMAKLTLAMAVMSTLQGAIYLGLPLNLGFFSSPFLYVALLGVFEIPSYILTSLILNRMGRKTAVITCFFSCGCLLLSVSGFLAACFKNEWVVFIGSLLSYQLLCMAYAVNVLYIPELFPTTLRPWSEAVNTLSDCLGFTIIPFILDYAGKELPWVPNAVFGGCAIIAGSLVFLLPETNGRSLPETVADLNRRLEEERAKKLNSHKIEPIALLTYKSDGKSMS